MLILISRPLGDVHKHPSTVPAVVQKLLPCAAPRGDQNGPMWRALCAVLFLAVLLTPALAEVRIEASPGGEASSFVEFFEQLRQSRERVVIDGPCFSACTLVLIIIPKSRICVTQRAVFGFHAAKAIDQYGREYPAPEATRVVAAAYPAPIRNWIRRHGGLTRIPIFLSGRDLAAMYPRCG